MAELSLFRNEWEDIQSTAQQTEGATRFNYVANVGNTEGEGVEWGLLWKPLEGLTFNFSGGIIDTEFVTTDISKRKGDPVDHVAPRTAAIGAAYNFHLWGPYRGMVRWDTTYSDRTEYTNRTPAFSYESDIQRFSNFKLGVEHERFQIYGFVRNVFDYRANVDANEPLLQSKSRPRSIGVELKFGV
jgi:outer membrane receptor for ferrienterochelin and colicin